MSTKTTEKEFIRLAKELRTVADTILGNPKFLKALRAGDPAIAAASVKFRESVKIAFVGILSRMEGDSMIFDTEKALALTQIPDDPSHTPEQAGALITSIVQTHVETGLLEPLGGTRYLVHPDTHREALREALDENKDRYTFPNRAPKEVQQ